MANYEFRPFGRDDLPMIAGWLRAEHVAKWWGEPEEQLALVTEDLDEPAMRQWIVSYLGRPFAYAQAYAQAYAPLAWPQDHLGGLPDGAVAIDVFIGEPEMVGRSHGSAFLRILAQMLIADGASVVAIDPDADNHRARRAYEKAGFTGDEVVETSEGPTILMLFRPLPRPIG